MTEQQAAEVLSLLQGLQGDVRSLELTVGELRDLLDGVLSVVTALACVVAATCGYIVGRRQG